jgi:hypothetical protein
MKEISHLLRLAYLTILQPLQVEGVTIPISDLVLNPNTVVPTYRNGKCYVLIGDQNEVENSNNDCSFRQTATINLDIVTKYPMNGGSRLASEYISNVIQEKVNLLTGQAIVFEEQGFQVLSTRKVFANTFQESGQSIMVYRKRLTFAHTIYQSGGAVVNNPMNTLNLTLNASI